MEIKRMLSYMDPLMLDRTNRRLVYAVDVLGAAALIVGLSNGRPLYAAIGGLCGAGVGLLHTYRVNSMRQSREMGDIERPGGILNIRL